MITPYDRGWGDPRRGPFPTVAYDIGEGVRLNVRNDDVGAVFHELVRRLMAAGWDGPKDPVLDDWGYNRRLKRWAEALGHTMATAPLDEFSDHSWATAIDLDTIPNPMLNRRPADMWAHTNMPRTTAAIAAGLGIEWGGTWTEPWDPQHFQIAMTPAETAARAQQIRNAQVPAPPAIRRETAMLVRAQKGTVLVIGDQRYGLNREQAAELFKQQVPLIDLTGDVLGPLGTRVLEGTPVQ